jgi:hypothetical protein
VKRFTVPEPLRLWWKRRQRQRELARDAARVVRSAQETVPLVDVTREGRIITRGGPTKIVVAPETVPFGSLSASELESRLADLAAAFNGIPYPHRVKFVATSRAGGWERSLQERRENAAALVGPEKHLALAAVEQLRGQIARGAVRQRSTFIVAEHDDPRELTRIAEYLCRAFRGRIVRGQEALDAERLAWKGKYLPDSGMWIVGGSEAGDPEMVVVKGKATVRQRPPDPVLSSPSLPRSAGQSHLPSGGNASAHRVARVDSEALAVDDQPRPLPHG